MQDIFENIFLKILNMSMTASYVILALLIVRLLLKKAPKKYSYALWAVALFRLACPVSFKSVISIFTLKPFTMIVEDAAAVGTAQIVHIPENIGLMAQPEISTGLEAVNTVVNSSLPVATPMYSANPMQYWIFFGMLLWLVGIAVLVAVSTISLIKLHCRLRTATLLEGNVWQSENVRSPFIVGLFRPRIYIPYGLNETQLGHVLAHERGHIKRLDHVVRSIAYLILCLHWFNPLVWLAFYLMGKDMELSCDEKVLGNTADKAEYSETLLSFAAPRHFPTPTPLAFGESAVGQRIKNALRWRKPRLWMSAIALALCLVVIAACAANPAGEVQKDDILGEWVAVRCEYIAPVPSSSPLADGNAYIYDVGEDGLVIIDRFSGELCAGYSVGYRDGTVGWHELPYSQTEWEALFPFASDDMERPQLANYEEILYQPLFGNDYFQPERHDPGTEADKFFLLVDGELWLVRTDIEANGQRFISSIYVLAPAESLENPAATESPEEIPLAPSEEIPAASPWELLAGLEPDKNKLSYVKGAGFGFGQNLDMDEISKLVVEALREVSSDEVVSGRGIPWQYSMSLSVEEGYITIGYGAGIVELQLSDELKEKYPAPMGTWEVHNEALTILLENLSVPYISEYVFGVVDDNEVPAGEIYFNFPDADMIDISVLNECSSADGKEIYSYGYTDRMFTTDRPFVYLPIVKNGLLAKTSAIRYTVWQNGEYTQGQISLVHKGEEEGQPVYWVYAAGDTEAEAGDNVKDEIVRINPIDKYFRKSLYVWTSGIKVSDIKAVYGSPDTHDKINDDFAEKLVEAINSAMQSEVRIENGNIVPNDCEISLSTKQGGATLIYNGNEVRVELSGELFEEYQSPSGHWVIDSRKLKNLFDQLLWE